MAIIYAIHESTDGKGVMITKDNKGIREVLEDNVPLEDALSAAFKYTSKGDGVYLGETVYLGEDA